MRKSIVALLFLSVVLMGCVLSAQTEGPPVTLLPPQTLPSPTRATSIQGGIYYVREDGGSALECTGLADAPYPGSGTGQPCAWNHPFQALPPDDAPRIARGDTLIIASGLYMMGYGAPGADLWI